MGQPDVIVVGGGIVGAACARSLALRGLHALVLDSGTEPGIATHAAAGMLAPLIESRHDDALLSLGVLARDLYHDLAPALEETTGIDIGLWTDGVLHLAFDDGDHGRLKNEIGWQRQQGYNTDWLSEDDLRDRAPGITDRAIGALVSPEDGALHAGDLMRALLTDAEAFGATLEHGQAVTEIVTEDGRAVGVRLSSGLRTAGAVVVAAGCWSGRLGGLPRPLSVEPIRGQMAAFPWPASEPPTIVYGANGYVLYRGDEALVGTTMEHVGFDAANTDDGIAHIVEVFNDIYPGHDATPVRSWAGLRPCTPDGYPIIGADPTVEGLWYATGHGRNGILFSGITGELIGQMIAGESVEYSLEAVEPGRFWRF